VDVIIRKEAGEDDNILAEPRRVDRAMPYLATCIRADIDRVMKPVCCSPTASLGQAARQARKVKYSCGKVCI
jgi:hypothetical protein